MEAWHMEDSLSETLRRFSADSYSHTAGAHSEYYRGRAEAFTTAASFVERLDQSARRDAPCVCGACRRDHPSADCQWAFYSEAGGGCYLGLRDGHHCPKCGGVLVVPEDAVPAPAADARPDSPVPSPDILVPAERFARANGYTDFRGMVTSLLRAEAKMCYQKWDHYKPGWQDAMDVSDIRPEQLAEIWAGPQPRFAKDDPVLYHGEKRFITAGPFWELRKPGQATYCYYISAREEELTRIEDEAEPSAPHPPVASPPLPKLSERLRMEANYYLACAESEPQGAEMFRRRADGMIQAMQIAEEYESAEASSPTPKFEPHDRVLRFRAERLIVDGPYWKVCVPGAEWEEYFAREEELTRIAEAHEAEVGATPSA